MTKPKEVSIRDMEQLDIESNPRFGDDIKSEPIPEISKEVKSQTDLVDFGGNMIPKDKVEELRQFCNQTEGEVTEFKLRSLLRIDEKGKIRINYPGDLTLHDCTRLRSLPEGLQVERDLKIFGGTGFESFPEGLIVGGDLFLDRCNLLKKIPKGLHVGEHFNIEKCPELESIEGEISIGKSLRINECPKLRSLPEGLTIGEDLYILYCHELENLPINLKVGNSLVINACKKLKTISKGTEIGKNLEFNFSESLETLPEELAINGILNLYGCKKLKKMPRVLTVNGDVLLNGCMSIRVLPDVFSVGEILDLSGCISLEALPEGLRVTSLILNNCPSLYTYQTYRRLSTINPAKISGFPYEEMKEMDAILEGRDPSPEFLKKYQLIKENIGQIEIIKGTNLIKLAIEIFEVYRAGFRAEFKILQENSQKPETDKDQILERIKEIKNLINNKKRELQTILRNILSLDLMTAIREQTEEQAILNFIAIN